MITLWVKYKSLEILFFVHFFYAFNHANERRDLWREMEAIGRSVGQNPWIILKPFKFFTHVTNHPRFLKVVARVWNESPSLFHSRSALSKFQKKLKALKSERRGLNKDLYGDLPGRVKQAYEELCARQTKAMQNPQTSTFETTSEAWERWHHITCIEEQFYYRKSRVQWLGLGERNSRFFHKVTQSRNVRNTIR